MNWLSAIEVVRSKQDEIFGDASMPWRSKRKAVRILSRASLALEWRRPVSGHVSSIPESGVRSYLKPERRRA